MNHRNAMLFLALLGAAMPVFAADHPSFGQLPESTGLPDPLVGLDGKKVTEKGEWPARKTQLRDLVEHYMYGRIPAKVSVKATTLFEDKEAMGGLATLREVDLRLGEWESPRIRLLMAIPNKREGKVPAFLGINFHGNSAVLDDKRIALPLGYLMSSAVGQKGNRATDAGRGSQTKDWAIEQTLKRGYAVCVFHCADVAPDKPGVDEMFFKQNPLGPDKDGGGTATISVWAWGMMRALDHLETCSEIDAERVAAVGHSRLGKTAIVAGAFDDRFALLIPHQAGCGGTAPSRGTVGEMVRQINDRFPHWFCKNFKSFNENTKKIPFDQHSLVALCAPRPILFSNALEDTWANPDGQFEVLKAADGAYRLLSPGGLDSINLPPVGELSPGLLGYWKRKGKHSMNAEDWKVFCDYADRHLKPKTP